MFSCEYYLSIRDKNIRVPPVGHGPVEKSLISKKTVLKTHISCSQKFRLSSRAE